MKVSSQIIASLEIMCCCACVSLLLHSGGSHGRGYFSGRPAHTVLLLLSGAHLFMDSFLLATSMLTDATAYLALKDTDLVFLESGVLSVLMTAVSCKALFDSSPFESSSDKQIASAAGLSILTSLLCLIKCRSTFPRRRPNRYRGEEGSRQQQHIPLTETCAVGEAVTTGL